MCQHFWQYNTTVSRWSEAKTTCCQCPVPEESKLANHCWTLYIPVWMFVLPQADCRSLLRDVTRTTDARRNRAWKIRHRSQLGLTGKSFFLTFSREARLAFRAKKCLEVFARRIRLKNLVARLAFHESCIYKYYSDLRSLRVSQHIFWIYFLHLFYILHFISTHLIKETQEAVINIINI
jgi:hypothetical protein